MNNKAIPHYDSAQISILAKLQNTVSSLKYLHEKSTEQQTDNNALEEITFKKVNEKHLIEIQSLKEELSRKTTYIKELENHQKSQESTLMTNFKFQLTQLEMALSQREAQNQSLQRQILRQKQKLTQLESQLSNEKQQKEFYQNNFKKLIETAKGQLKQIHVINQENQLTNFMSSSMFKQLTDRIQTFNSIGLEKNLKNTMMEEKYIKVKKDLNKLMERNNSLEIQNQRLTEKLWSLQNGMNYTNNKGSKSKFINGDNLMTLEKQSKFSIRSKDDQATVVKNNNSQYIPLNKPSIFKTLNNYPSTLLFQKLQQTFNTISQYKADMQSIGSSLSQINTKLTEQQQTWSQVLTVKQMNTRLKDQLNELKQEKVNPLLSDQLLKTQHPTLFKYFTDKMSQLQQFENRLQKMQTQSVRIIELIDKIMYEGVPTSKPIQPSSKQIQQHQHILRSKLKKQLQSKFQHQKQIYRQQIQNHLAQKQASLSQQINRLNKEVQRLRLKNQDMFKLINQMEKHQQQILQQAQEMRRQESIMQSSNKKPMEQTQTQLNSKIPSPKQQIDKQLLGYLQQKCEDLERELSQVKSVCQKYKKELRFVLQNYKVKSTKLKVTRCNECLFTISNEKVLGKKCEKCKVEFHQGECFNEHDMQCKKKVPTTRVNNNQGNNNNTKKMPQQKKRTSNNLANSIVSQNVDYF